MVDVRSDQRKVEVERRKHPRLEFHCDATVLGIYGILTITDISLGGVFVEASIPDNITVGRTIIINTKLDSQRNMFRKNGERWNRRIGTSGNEIRTNQHCLKSFNEKPEKKQK